MTLEHKNTRIQELVSVLKKHALEQKSGVWRRVAVELERPTRLQRVVNLSKIEKHCNDNDVVIVLGKLLSGGELSKKVTIIAFNYSQKAQEKIGKTQVLTLEEGFKKYPDAKNIKIIG
jgi:large subunit ribosomal protein L18e